MADEKVFFGKGFDEFTAPEKIIFALFFFSSGVFSAGIFSDGIFSIGIFSIGVFSIGIFNIGVIAMGFFLIAWKKKYAKCLLAEETESGKCE